MKENCILASLFLCFLCQANNGNLEEISRVERVDGSKFNVLISRPNIEKKIPILLMIDGSGCYSSYWQEVKSGLALPKNISNRVARVVVDKPGLKVGQAWSKECNPEFLKHYSIDDRVFDHLRTLQYLKKHVAWWNEEVYVYGYSDGATIGVLLSAYSPLVKKSVLGGFGGGITMANLFHDYINCQKGNKIQKEDCVKDQKQLFNKMRDNPTYTKTWSGGDNSYKVWATRLDKLEQILLQDFTIPFLIMQGANDRYSVPVASAKKLIKNLKKNKDLNFEYWEIPDMAHTFNSLPPNRSKLIKYAMLNWLFDEKLGKGGPPNFGKSSK